MAIVASLGAFSAALAAQSAAGVQRARNASGVWSFAEIRALPAAAPATAVNHAAPASDPAPAGAPAAAAAHGGPQARIRRLLDRAARRYRLSPRLVRAVARQESGFLPRALSTKGAMGVMQLMPGTARALRVRRPFDAAQNIDGGVRFLRDLLARYHGNRRLALAAYNAGPGAVDRYRGVPPYRETRGYVRAILAHLRLPASSGGGSRLAAERPRKRSAPPVVLRRGARGSLIFSNTD